MVSKLRHLVSTLVARAGTGCPRVAVAIPLTIDRRLNPAPFSLIATEPPAGVYQGAVATMSVDTRNKSTLISDNGIKGLTLPPERSLGTRWSQYTSA